MKLIVHLFIYIRLRHTNQLTIQKWHVLVQCNKPLLMNCCTPILIWMGKHKPTVSYCHMFTDIFINLELMKFPIESFWLKTRTQYLLLAVPSNHCISLSPFTSLIQCLQILFEFCMAFYFIKHWKDMSSIVVSTIFELKILTCFILIKIYLAWIYHSNQRNYVTI